MKRSLVRTYRSYTLDNFYNFLICTIDLSIFLQLSTIRLIVDIAIVNIKIIRIFSISLYIWNVYSLKEISYIEGVSLVLKSLNSCFVFPPRF